MLFGRKKQADADNRGQQPEKKKAEKKIPVHILSVCGAGTVTSSMVALKIKEELGKRGYDVRAVESSPNRLDMDTMSHSYDLMCCITPVDKDYGIPKVNAVGLLSGVGEDEILEECVRILKENGK